MILIGSTQKNAFVGDGEICCTLTEAMGMGGGQVPMIVETPCLLTPDNFSHKAGDGTGTRKRNVSYICPALQANAGGSQQTYVLDKATAAAMRGRYDENGKVQQQFEISDREYSNALTTVEKDALVFDGLMVRRLTPKECFRLMGFDDADFDLLAENGISNTQLYKMAGNSIVVNMLEFLFCQIFDSDNEIWV